MLRALPIVGASTLALSVLSLGPLSCFPKSDLDAAARGATESQGGSSQQPTTEGGRSGSGAGGSNAGSAGAGTSGSAGGNLPLATGGAGNAGWGNVASGSGGALDSGGRGSSAGSSEAGDGGTPVQEPLSALPPSLNGSPVAGEITFSAEATWEVNGVSEPAFEVQTPTAGYFLVKKLGMIVSMVDRSGGSGREWIGYSDAFRPKRGLPRFGGCCQADAKAVLATTLDTDSLSKSHVRLRSESAEGAWSLVWDFYQTHVTLTVNRAGADFSFQYRGAPGGALNAGSRVVLADGQSYSALDGYVKTPLSGPLQWAYVADDTLQRSLFVMQYAADDLQDSYSVSDADTAVLTLGDAALAGPVRFSFGLVDSSTLESVQARIEFVASVTPPN